MLCKDCAKEKIKFENWINLNLKTLFSLEDDNLVSEALSYLEIGYCPNCGYFDFDCFKECPNCGYKRGYFEGCFGVFKKDKIIEHLKELYWEVPSYVNPFYTNVNLYTLLNIIAAAKYFINVASEGLDPFFAGVLATKAKTDCKIKVVVMKQDDFLRKFVESIWELNITIKYNFESHQKLVVVDSILAFKGSANFTFAGWTREGETRELVTEPAIVKELNDKHFVPYYKWGKEIKL